MSPFFGCEIARWNRHYALGRTDHPAIPTLALNAESTGDGVWQVRGSLTIHGQSRPIELEVRGAGGHYRGSTRLKQSEFGIKPVKIAGGTKRVKDEIRIDFDIQLAR